MTTSHATPSALVTGADRGLGFAMVESLLAKGWQVYAGQVIPTWTGLADLSQRYPRTLHILPLDVREVDSAQAAAASVAQTIPQLDLLINNAGVNSASSAISIRDGGLDYQEMHRLYDVNALGALRVTEAFLPLLDRGTLKRLCFVSSEAGSIGAAKRTAWYGYCMSKAALNMTTKLLFNLLRPEGYSFRVYHPGWVRSYISGVKNTAADLEPEEAAVPALAYFLETRDDEDRLVLRDWEGKEWPW